MTLKDIRKSLYLKNRDGIWCLDISPDGKCIATVSSDNTFRFWNPSTYKATSNIDEHAGKLYWVKFNHSGTMVATCGSDYCVKVWDLKQMAKPAYNFKSKLFTIHS